MSEEFLTIAQAAAALGISERQAHRYAARLATEDRQKSDKGQTLVRWMAMRALLPGKRVTAQNTPLPDAMSDMRQTHDRQESGSALISELRARIADKDAELARVWQSHERLQVLLQDEQRLHRLSQERIRELEEANVKLIAALPVSDIRQTDGRQMAEDDTRKTGDSQMSDILSDAMTDPYENTVTASLGALGRAPTSQGDTFPIPTDESVSAGKISEKRPWWKLWRR